MKTREINEKDLEMFNVLMHLKEQSKCVDRQVACIIVDEDYNIVSQGVNTINNCDKNCHDKINRVCDVEHAEMMAARNLSMENITHYELKAYVSLCPCIPCQEALNMYVDEIVYFGMTHKDIDPDIEHKITRFPHLNYEIFCNEYAGDFERSIINTLNNLKESVQSGICEHTIKRIVETEIELEQLKLWLYESNKEFYNELRDKRNSKLKEYLSDIEEK